MTTAPAILTVENRLNDADITAAIGQLFRSQKGVMPSLIEVGCREGIVELTGFTNNLLSRERAADIAKAVRGVRGIINAVIISTPDVSDADLQRRAELALLQDLVAGDYPVHCHAHDGELTVHGTVQSWAEGQLVTRILHGVPGVRQLHNQLAVRGSGAKRTNEEITNQIHESLALDICVKSVLIGVRADNGLVYLLGTVGSATEHDHVVALAYQAGALQVNAHSLCVEHWAMDAAFQHQKSAPKPDEDVAQAVRDARRNDPRAHSFGTTVQMRAGVVTLMGTVGNLRIWQAARQDARNVVGVLDVKNLLEIKSLHPSSDHLIHENVCAALANDAYLGHCKFTTAVTDGQVHLSGTVAAHFDQERAADVVAGINGVVALTNLVQVVPIADAPGALADNAPVLNAVVLGYGPNPPTSLAPDYLLEQRLRTRLYWSAQLHAQDIHLQVHDGRVMLTGTVDTWLDYKAAAAEAYTCGARDVDNQLRLSATN